MIEGYIPKDKRKKILLLCDDIRMHSGIATMAREIVVNSAQRFNWFNIGAAIKHPDLGKIVDLSDNMNKRHKIKDADVKILPSNGYGDANLVRRILRERKIAKYYFFQNEVDYQSTLVLLEVQLDGRLHLILQGFFSIHQNWFDQIYLYYDILLFHYNFLFFLMKNYLSHLSYVLHQLINQPSYFQ